MFQDREHDPVDVDGAALAAWRGGDPLSGAALFERHYASVARFFHHKVSGAAQDDLVHETFLACLEAAARFRGQSCFRTFLFGIAHRVLAGHGRRAARSSARCADGYDPEELPAGSFAPCPAATLAAEQEQRHLREALRRIPQPYQLALKLHYWDGLTAAQIGESSGIPLGTAKTRLRDGRRALAAQLERLAR